MNAFYVTNFLLPIQVLFLTLRTSLWIKQSPCTHRKMTFKASLCFPLSTSLPCSVNPHVLPHVPIIQFYMAGNKAQICQNLEALGPELGCSTQIKCIPRIWTTYVIKIFLGATLQTGQINFNDIFLNPTNLKYFDM